MNIFFFLFSVLAINFTVEIILDLNPFEGKSIYHRIMFPALFLPAFFISFQHVYPVFKLAETSKKRLYIIVLIILLTVESILLVYPLQIIESLLLDLFFKELYFDLD